MRLRISLILFLSMLIYSTCFALTLRSASFDNGGPIRSTYTCDADNISPELSWGDVPSGTKSLALICDDPDAPSKTWTHWIIFNIPPEKKGLEEAVPMVGTFDDGTIQGLNDFGKIGYGGPCPPPNGAHRYFFRLYALDNNLILDEYASKDAVLRTMQGHILAEAEIFGTYSR